MLRVFEATLDLSSSIFFFFFFLLLFKGKKHLKQNFEFQALFWDLENEYNFF